MNYFINKKGYPQADFRNLRFMRFDEPNFKEAVIKTYSKRGFLKNYGLRNLEKAKNLWGEKFVIIAFVRENELVVILEA